MVALENSNDILTIDFVIPCGRPDSKAAKKTLSSLAGMAERLKSKVIIVGKDVSKIKSQYPSCFIWVDTKKCCGPQLIETLVRIRATPILLLFWMMIAG